MSSYQCLGAEEAIAHGMCLPSRQGVGDQLGAALARVGLGAVFVASDVDPDVKDLQRRLGPHVRNHVMSLCVWLFLCLFLCLHVRLCDVCVCVCVCVCACLCGVCVCVCKCVCAIVM